MNKLLRGLIAGYGAKKLGTGCFSTILIFILIWVALGQCEGSSFGERRNQKQHIERTYLQKQALLADGR